MNVYGKNLKTLSSNMDYEMIDDVLNFHNKSNILIDKKFYSCIAPYALSYDQLKSLERSDYEISPFYSDNIECNSSENNSIRRNHTAVSFAHQKISFSSLTKLLNQSFSDDNGHRPYPSAGALYPVEVLCYIFSEKLHNSPPSGIYHYRPLHRVLQPLKKIKSEQMRDAIYSLELEPVKEPSFAFLYIAVLEKMLVKYRYRGYRYALMEAGAMFQQADLVSQSLGLINKLYSGFNDHEIVKCCGIDGMNFIPLVVQSFGVPL